MVHGYKMSCIAIVEPAPSLNIEAAPSDGVLLIAGSDEKVLRLYKSPSTFLRTLLAFSSQSGHKENESMCRALLEGDGENAIGALVPALGLTNKAIYDDEDDGEASEQATGWVTAPG